MSRQRRVLENDHLEDVRVFENVVVQASPMARSYRVCRKTQHEIFS